MAWFKKKEKPLQFDLTPAQRAAVDTALKDKDITKALISFVDEPTSPALTQMLSQDKNSYAFWGPTTAQLVATPNSFFVPISYDAFKVSGMDHDFKSKKLESAYEELFIAASKVYSWSQHYNLDGFFLKNANFSGKHRWPYTCNIDFSHMTGATPKDKVLKILNNFHNINSYAMLHWTTPGLGLLAREKLDLEPMFYAFGSTFYKLINKKTGASKILPFDTAHQNVDDYIKQATFAHIDLTFEKVHIGMPITKELRIFSLGGDIQGYVPYWSPVAFKNQLVYGLPDGAVFDDVLRKMNTFETRDLEYLHGETKKIIKHPKFSDTDWAIDWVLTRDGKWYMIDMQTAPSSHMDVENMIFATPNSKSVVYNFINSQYDKFNQMVQNMTPFQKMVARLSGTPLDVEKRMTRFGYPNMKQLNEIRKQIGAKTI